MDAKQENSNEDGRGAGAGGLTHEQALEVLGPLPFSKNSFGFATDPGFLMFIAVILDVGSVGVIWAIPQAPQPDWRMLWIPAAWVLMSAAFWLIAVKKRRWMKKYRELTEGSPGGAR